MKNKVAMITGASVGIGRAVALQMAEKGALISIRENADLICFLASEKNGYIVGQNIKIDGCRKII